MAKSLVIGSFPSKACSSDRNSEWRAHKSFNYGRASDFPEVLSTIISHSAPYHYFSQSQSFCWEEEVGLLFLLHISKHSTKSLSGYKEALMSFLKTFFFCCTAKKNKLFIFSTDLSQTRGLNGKLLSYLKVWSARGILFVSSYLDEFLSACPACLLRGMLSKGPLLYLLSLTWGLSKSTATRNRVWTKLDHLLITQTQLRFTKYLHGITRNAGLPDDASDRLMVWEICWIGCWWSPRSP